MYLLVTEEKYGREVRIIPVDFTKGQEVYSAIQAEISDLDVAVLGEAVVTCFSYKRGLIGGYI